MRQVESASAGPTTTNSPVVWTAVAARRRHEIESKIPVEWRVPKPFRGQQWNVTSVPRESGIMTAEELLITESRAVDILEAIRQRQWTSVQVTRAFCKRAAIAHQVTNCLAEVMFDAALQRAAELDEHMDRHGKPKGPLHGLPISVKEHIYLDGTRATSGLIAWADNISPKDALICQTFRSQGAVFYVKTTNPQTLMALETDSNLFGRTLNPYNTTLTSGGSSGGEAALIAMRGSVLGIGTDIGGSIRVPSAFCGIYGLKPSVGRLPHSGLSGLHNGMHNIIGCVGPMATCVEDMELFCKAALSEEPWDWEPSLIRIPWLGTPVETPIKLKVGVMWHDGIVRPHPPVMRALKDAVEALRSAGHEIVDWEPRHHRELINTVNQAYFLDGGKEYWDTLHEGGEGPVSMIKWLLDTEAGTRCTLEETWKVNAEMDRLRTLYAEQWRSTGVDVLLCPVNPSVASAHGESKYWGYSSVFNALDLPGAVIPAGTVQKTDTWAESPDAAGPSLGLVDEWYRQKYDSPEGPEKYSGAPVSLQLVGKRLQEEKLLSCVRSVESALARYIEHLPVSSENTVSIRWQNSSAAKDSSLEKIEAIAAEAA